MANLLQELKQVIDKAAEDAKRVKEQEAIIRTSDIRIQYISAQLYELANQHNVYIRCIVCAKETKERVAYSCGHMYQCMACDKKQTGCPVCKTSITLRLNVTLP